MNSSIVRIIIGQVLKVEAALLLLPCITALVYQEQVGIYYLMTAAACLVVGFIFTFRKSRSDVFYLKEGLVATSLSWVVLSIFGAVPFYISGEIPSYVDALFETVSGFTTTGSSILTDVEVLSRTALFWRSFTHWVGGMGVLVFLLAIIPLSGGSNFNLMKAESPGPSVGKLVPKVAYTARILYVIYFGISVIETILLMAGGMTFYESILTTFGTAGTGGFGFLNSSMGSFSPYLQWVITIFMILFGVNFNAYYFILFRKVKKAFQMEEVRAYFLIIVLAVAAITGDLVRTMNFSNALRTSAFQVGSIITTTGFSTADFNTWSQTSRTILVLLMFIGACAGSTGGGIKVSRILVLIKTVFKELNSFLHPKSIKKIKMDDKPIEHEVVRATNVYFCSYMIIFAFSVLLISLEDYDLITNFTAVAATFNNIGPGLELVGPAANFSFLNSFSKCILIFDMLAGRLELFPLLILFHPVLWKEVLSRKRKIVQSRILDRKQ